MHATKKDSNHGFTITELLIVIVVIAVLAGIIVVAYNGIVKRSKDTKTMVELKSFGKGSELYYITNNKYPTTDAEFAELLKKAGIDTSKQDPNATYAFCSSDGKYTLAVWEGVNQPRKRGDIIKYVSGTGQVTEHVLTNSSLEADPVVVYKVCNQIFGTGYTYDQWSHVIVY